MGYLVQQHLNDLDWRWIRRVSILIFNNTFTLTPSPEYLLLQQAIQLAAPAPALLEAQRLLEKHPINWPFFLDLAEYHAIRPQAATLLRQLPTGLVPAPVITQLQEVRREIAYQQMNNVAEFLQIQQLLQSEGVTTVPYKGFWLAHTAYGDLAEREGSDVDLFMAPQDLTQVQKIMYARGYETELDSLGSNAQGVLQYHGEYNFKKFQGDVALFLFEFHASPGNQKLGFNISLNELQDQIQHPSFQGRSIATFSPSAQLLLAVVHHGAKVAWLSLKYVLDIAKLLQSHGHHLDWPWLLRMNQRHDCAGLFWVGVGLAQTLTGIALAVPVQAGLQEAKVARLVQNRLKALAQVSIYTPRGYRNYAQQLWFLFKAQRSWASRWALILNHLQPQPIFGQNDPGENRWILRFWRRIRTIVWVAFREKK